MRRKKVHSILSRTEKRGAGRSATPRMSITTDAEKWITENLGPITGQRGMGGGSGWASLALYLLDFFVEA